MSRFSRRNFLRGTAGAAMALPLLNHFAPRRVRGAEPSVTPPKRVIIFFHPNGMVMDRWRCTVNPSDPSDFQLSEILAPLEAHKQDLLIMEGIDMASSYGPMQQATAHEGGAASLLTGYWAGPGDMNGGGGLKAGYAISHSIDHYLGQRVGEATPFNALHFGVKNTAANVTTRISYAGKDLPINPNPNPWDMASKIFAGGGNVPHRKRVLSEVISDFQALNCRLGADDRARLEQHLDSVVTIEGKLDILQASEGCQSPPLGTPPVGGTQVDANMPTYGKVQMDLIVQALTCDLTRVAALQWAAPVVNTTYTFLGQTEVHHTLSHDTSLEAELQLTQVYTWYAEQLAYLLNALKGVVEPDGSTLLDNTAVLWCSEISRGWDHYRRDMPFVLAGGCQGYFSTGRYLTFEDGPSHNRLLLSLLHAMDVPDATFGAPEFCQGGVLPGLTG